MKVEDVSEVAFVDRIIFKTVLLVSMGALCRSTR